VRVAPPVEATLSSSCSPVSGGRRVEVFKLGQFKASIDHHLLKGNTFIVIDMPGDTAEQIAAVRAHVDTLPAGRIIRVGF
jgi:hypothetical protein